jgi:hypothetical protein
MAYGWGRPSRRNATLRYASKLNIQYMGHGAFVAEFTVGILRLLDGFKDASELAVHQGKFTFFLSSSSRVLTNGRAGSLCG